ncbi:hypothetical protein FE257_005716 [Aspergillus nanangensis]|uniref:Carboxylic ester hydrolase n=1 Tax=Aspergillus nanangensis TaxID=2582783 RepID=A0AAD4CQ01_ASPNN|nr:hypothetical protein FE257_005716 [Aspergillus nanangensis]
MVLLVTRCLGEIEGRSDGHVDEYLGIPYATLANAWAEAVPVSSLNGTVLDATKEGPTAISPPTGCDLEFSVMQHGLPRSHLAQSDTDCLNLNITTPHGADNSSALPVFVFIHGGGFQIGANSWPQFNLGRFVKLSMQTGTPVIGVTINYRLGAFGFLTSEELRRRGYKANNGLRDQRAALQWIERHIADFGGDPENITVSGISAGGASVMYHLTSTRPLFKRAIVMSGNYFLLPPLSLSTHEENYNRAIVALGLADVSTDERIQTLVETPAHELASCLPPFVIAAPAIDGDIVAATPTFQDIANPNNNSPKGKSWCQELLIGDAQMDGNIIRVLMPDADITCADRFIDILNTTLQPYPDLARKILQQYNISRDLSDTEAFSHILDFFNDIAFFMPTLATAQGWAGKAFVYHFNQGNPWDGPSKGRAGHLLDVVYLFQNFREFLTPDQQALSRQMAVEFLRFCHGQSPWRPVQSARLEERFHARVFGSRDGRGGEVRDVGSPFGEEADRRSVLWEAASEASLDELLQVFHLFRGF